MSRKLKITNSAIVLIIMGTAALLRFYHYFEVPFTYDEFSAVLRLNFDSFSELIEKGVKLTDTHPAGVQVLMYYWTRLFGLEEWVVKLPFTLFGLGSVYLIYLIGKKWYNQTVGLLSSAFLASLQYTVMYSQIARPYISGLFLVLLTVYFWTNLVKNPERKYYLNSLGFIFSAAACAYNHHFSLLFAAIVGLSGLFFIRREYLIRYIISGVLIFVLYIPHLNIFFYQLNVGGIEDWLGKPSNSFILKYIGFIFNFSVYPGIVTLIIILLGFFFFRTDTAIKKEPGHRRDLKPLYSYLLFASWFLIPLIIGFLYSRYVQAVLQYSVLIFSFPFLFFVLFGHIKEQKPSINLVMVICILIVNIYSLTFVRKYYQIFYKSPDREILRDYEELKSREQNAIYIIDSHPKNTNFYIHKYGIDTGFIRQESLSGISELKSILEERSKTADKLYLGALSSNYQMTVPLILDYFPNLVKQNNYYGATTYIFDKEQRPTSFRDTITYLDFEKGTYSKWNGVKAELITKEITYSGESAYAFSDETEYGPTYKISLDSIMTHKNNFIDITVRARRISEMDGAVLIATLESHGEIIYYGGSDFKDFIISDSVSQRWESVHYTMKLSDINLNFKDLVLKVYVWNKNHQHFVVDDIVICRREGNPILYWLVEPIIQPKNQLATK